MGKGGAMGFFRFLTKKKETKVEDELDVPPAPPAPSIDKDLNIPFPGDEMTSQLSFPKQATSKAPTDDFDFEIPSPKPQSVQRPMPSMGQNSTAMTGGESEPMKDTIGKALYIEIDQFRTMVDDLTDIRSALKKTEMVMEHMITTEANRDKDYTTYRNLLNDTQKKLVFIDKTIFKGGLG